MKIFFQKFRIVIVLLFSFLNLHAYDFEIDSVYYNIISASEFTCSIVGGHPDLTSFQLNKTVEYKGRTLTIKNISGFDQTKLESLSFGNDVDTVPSHSFKACTQLKNIVFNNVKVIGNNAFLGSGKSDKLLTFGKVEVIENSAFKNSGFTRLDLSGVRIINNNAFNGCSRDSILIPPSVDYIGENAFDYNFPSKFTFEFCNKPIKLLKPYDIGVPDTLVINRNIISSSYLYYDNEIMFGPEVTQLPLISYSLSNFNPTLDLSTTNIKVIPESVFANKSRYKKIILPESLDSIKSKPFYRLGEYYSQPKLVLPKKLNYIGSSAFEYCQARGIVDTQEWAVDSLPDRVFYRSDLDLSQIVLPNTVKYIGKEAFANTNINSIGISQNVELVNADAFYNCDQLTTLIIDESDQPLKIIQGIEKNNIVVKGTSGKTEEEAYQKPAASFVYLRSPLCIPSVKNLKVGRDVVYNPKLEESETNIPEDQIYWYFVINRALASSLNLPNSSVETLEISNLKENPFNPREMEHSYVLYSQYNKQLEKDIINETYKLSPSLYPENLTNLNVFNCNLITPPVLSVDFPTSVYVRVTLYVPIGAKTNYESAPYWKNFWEIRESDFSGVNEIVADGENQGPIEWFNLNGIRMSKNYEELPSGIYILRQGSKSKKIFKK